MNISYITDKDFKGTDFSKNGFEKGEYENCFFENCNLHKAIFDNTILEKAYFRTSYGFSIDPDHNKIRKAKFSVMGLSGLLDKYDIDIE